jgi:hypothetical protein
MSSDPDHIARLEAEVDALEKQSKRLGDDISDVREDWQHKREDAGVPGAPPAEKGSAGDAEAREPWPDE